MDKTSSACSISSSGQEDRRMLFEMLKFSEEVFCKSVSRSPCHVCTCSKNFSFFGAKFMLDESVSERGRIADAEEIFILCQH